MNKEVVIIMYHYVRDLDNSRYPDIKGLSVESFKKQLAYLNEKYTFVTVEQCLKQLQAPDEKFPEDAALLTFDDGYKEHFTEVFPLLDSLGIQGAFFPPAQAIMEHKVLDANKIHFILASASDSKELIDSLDKMITDLSGNYDLKNPAYYFNKLDLEHRYDAPEIVYFKRMLQRELPEVVREIILAELYAKFVGVKETVFAKELYMSVDQIKCMLRHGMYIGGHGYSHKWLNFMSKKDKEIEVKKTVKFLEMLGVESENWVMSYPIGGYDEELIEILKEQDCAMGIGAEVGIAILEKSEAFQMKRMDCNDFPG